LQKQETAYGELRRCHKELEFPNSLLKEADRIKDEFINVAAHELRTPIQPILTYDELAQEGLVSQEESWTIVTKQAKRLRQLANDILDVSRIDGGNLVLRKNELDINALIKSLAKLRSQRRA
jgi:signal transduction histidine kinase